MLKRKIILPTVTNANPTTGKTSVVTVTPGYRVHTVLLNITANTGTNLPIGNWIGDIRVKLGGKVQRLHSAAELNKLNLVNGAAYGAYTVGVSGTNYGQVIPIFLAEPWRNDNLQAEWLAWNTSATSLMEIEIDTNGTPTGTTPTISITATAVVDTGSQAGSDKTGLQIVKVFRNDYPSAQNLDVTTLDRRDVYQGVYIAAANITRAIVKADSLPIHELYVADNKALLTQSLLSPQFDYDLVLDHDDALSSGLNANAARDLQLRIEQSAAAVIRILTMRLGTPE